MSESLPDRPNLRFLKDQAKAMVKAGEAATLAQAQFALARHYGFVSWQKLKAHVEAQQAEDPQALFDAIERGVAPAARALLDEHPEWIDVPMGWQQMRPLFHALTRRDENIADLLRNRGAMLDVFEASACGDLAALRQLLRDDPACVNARRDHYDATPLHCCRTQLAAAKLLLDAGADVNATDSEKQMLTPLHGRAEHGDVPMVQLLLARGANVHADSCVGLPLHACVGGHQHEPAPTWRTVAQMLLDAGNDVNEVSDWHRDWTPLHHAACFGHSQAITWLLQRGADPTLRNGHGHTPRETAVACKQPHLAPLFDEDRPPLRTRTTWHGMKLLGQIGLDVMRLVKADRLDGAKMMIDDFVASFGVDPIYRPDKYGDTPFELMAGRGNEILSFLEPHGIQWNAKNAVIWGQIDVLERLLAEDPRQFRQQFRHDATLLHIALRHAQFDAARWLQEHVGYDIAATEGNGYVRFATFSHNDDAVRLAVEMGAEVDHDPGQTALQHQCKHGRTACVETLLELGADPNRPQRADGRTALHLAVSTGGTGKLLHILLAAGAEAQARDHSGATPLDLARQAKRLTAAKTLEAWCAEHGQTP